MLRRNRKWSIRGHRPPACPSTWGARPRFMGRPRSRQTLNEEPFASGQDAQSGGRAVLGAGAVEASARARVHRGHAGAPHAEVLRAAHLVGLRVQRAHDLATSLDGRGPVNVRRGIGGRRAIHRGGRVCGAIEGGPLIRRARVGASARGARRVARRTLGASAARRINRRGVSVGRGGPRAARGARGRRRHVTDNVGLACRRARGAPRPREKPSGALLRDVARGQRRRALVQALRRRPLPGRPGHAACDDPARRQSEAPDFLMKSSTTCASSSPLSSCRK